MRRATTHTSLVLAALCLGGCYRTAVERLPVRTWEVERVRAGTVVEHDVEQLTVEGRLAAPSGRVALEAVEGAEADAARAALVDEALRRRLEASGLAVVEETADPAPDWVLASELAPARDETDAEASSLEVRLAARRPRQRQPFLRETVRGSTAAEIAERVASWTETRTVDRQVPREVPWYSLRRRAVVRYEEVERQVFAGRLVLGSTVASRLEPAIFAAQLALVVGVQFDEEQRSRDHLVTVETGITVPTTRGCQADVSGGFRVRYELRLRYEKLYVGPQLALGGFGAEGDDCDDPEAFDFTTRSAFDFASVAAVGGIDLGEVALGLDLRFGYGVVADGDLPETEGLTVDLGAHITFTM